jgi:starch synthase (maltosyl-transferring)
VIVYNIFPLLAGPFRRWKEHFSRAAALGFDWVFVNPIQQPGSSGSLYSIADYFQVNPLLVESGGPPAEPQVRQMIQEARGAGLKVMIDLVLNHCAIDSALTRTHPEWFVREHDGRIACASCQHDGERVVWRDLAQYDHHHTRDREGLYRHCLQVVEYLIGLGFEGFRCDAAYQVPTEVWHRLIREVKMRHPATCFVAETLGCAPGQTKETAAAGFDFVFNSAKWWDFNAGWLLTQYDLLRETVPSISFPESHDTERLGADLDGNVDGIKQRYLFAGVFSAGVMMPMGFEYGFRKRLHVVHTRSTDWECNGTDVSPFVAKVNAMKKAHAVFQEDGPMAILPCANPHVLLLWKGSARKREEALLILNKDIWNRQEFGTDQIRRLTRTGAPLRDVSPEYPLAAVHEPFHYVLRPGQGIVLVTPGD